MTKQLGKTLLIANPAAQNGNGAQAAFFAEEALSKALPPGSLELALPRDPSHARKVAWKSAEFDTVLALGGDGLIHETVNGLMKIADKERPQLGVLPMGTGNDYARTVGMSFKIEQSVAEIIKTHPQAFDVGLCNREYFVQTLSFGLDAAIALDTVQRRKRTGKTGTRVFVESGIDTVLHHLDEMGFSAVFDGEEREPRTAFIVAVQVGPTYGGGFRICPEARTDDDLLDICIASPPLNPVSALAIFLLAKNAHHTGFKQFEFLKAKSLTLKFDEEPPAQIDGEPITATTFEIESVPSALQVLTL